MRREGRVAKISDRPGIMLYGEERGERKRALNCQNPYLICKLARPICFVRLWTQLERPLRSRFDKWRGSSLFSQSASPFNLVDLTRPLKSPSPLLPPPCCIQLWGARGFGLTSKANRQKHGLDERYSYEYQVPLAIVGTWT